MNIEDLARDSALVGDLVSHIVDKGYKLFHDENKEHYKTMVNDVRKSLCTFINPDDASTVPATAAAYLAIWVGIATALEALDAFPSPANNEKLPKEIREEWAAVTTDWRASAILTLTGSVLSFIRTKQHEQNDLPLDMMKPEGTG